MNPDWRESAACRGACDTMFPTEVLWGHDPDYRMAARLCRECPVVDECLEDAMKWETQKGRYGFRGGMTPHQRDRFAIRRRGEAS